MAYLASLDQSTTSTKFSIFSQAGQLLAKEVIEHKQICPQEGLLEHDPLEIIANTHLCISRTLAQMQAVPGFTPQQIAGVGVTNQRETVVCWNAQGQPYYNAIVWCDTRCRQVCEQFKATHGEFKHKTGLPVSTYFTIFKILWLIQHVPEVRTALQNDDIFFGTIDTWILYNLTGAYLTDASNASRTYLCNLKGEWDEELMALAGLKKHQLPTIVDSFGELATITAGELSGVKVRCILGDQQSSAYAHELGLNEVKITYGTGCFLLANIGSEPAIHESLVTTILYKQGEKVQYAFECSVECGGGTLNWARRAGFFAAYAELNQLEDVTAHHLYFFPSFGEIYAPFWRSDVRGGMLGLNLSTTRPQITAAILESILFRIHDNLSAPTFASLANIYVDGGMTANPAFLQAQADLLNKKVTHRERDTCWGVAKGVLTSLSLPSTPFADQKVQLFLPNEQQGARLRQKYGRWEEERRRFYHWN